MPTHSVWRTECSEDRSIGRGASDFEAWWCEFVGRLLKCLWEHRSYPRPGSGGRRRAFREVRRGRASVLGRVQRTASALIVDVPRSRFTSSDCSSQWNSRAERLGISRRSRVSAGPCPHPRRSTAEPGNACHSGARTIDNNNLTRFSIRLVLADRCRPGM